MSKGYYTKYPINKATKPPPGGLCWVYTDRYWLVVDECILFYRGFSPQCNPDRRLCELRKDLAEADIVFLSQVFVPAREGMNGTVVDVHGARLEIE